MAERQEKTTEEIMTAYWKRYDDSRAYFKAIRKLSKEMDCEYICQELIDLYWRDYKEKGYEEQMSMAANFIWKTRHYKI